MPRGDAAEPDRLEGPTDSPKLLTRREALAFIDRCERQGIRIVAIEGFRVVEECRVSDMDALADFSDSDLDYTNASACKEARAFLGRMPPELLFEFALAP